MKFTVIEDCSPYYIRLTYPGIENFITVANTLRERYTAKRGIVHTKFQYTELPLDIGSKLIKHCPVNDLIPLQPGRVSYFISDPGLYYYAHKDGTDHRVSFNYTLSIKDDKCITSWYSDEECSEYNVSVLQNKSRECQGFVKEKHKPLKTMTAVQGELIIFNTEIYHDWDNRESDNERVVLTLRAIDVGNVYFEDAKNKLLNDKG